MNIYFKRFLSLFVLIGLSCGVLKPIDDVAKFTYLVTSVAKLPAGSAVLYAHAKSNENLEVKLKLIEALVQVTNEAAFHVGYRYDVGYLDNAWFGFEVFRVIKYLRKYLENRKKKGGENIANDAENNLKEESNIDGSNAKSESNNPANFEQLMHDFHLTEQEVAKLLEDESFSLDNLVNDIEDESFVSGLLDDNKSEAKSKGFLFKVKVGFCFILLILETSNSLLLCRDDGIPNFKRRNPSLFQKGLRYFLLSESGSLEAKIAITMSILSYLKTVQQVTKTFMENERARYNAYYEQFNVQLNQSYQEEQDARNLFGFPVDFTQQELNKEYRILICKWHPDKNLNRKDEATKMSAKINNYYEILKKKLEDKIK